jgi:sRNA-binding regulator protein Hfq
MMSFVEYVNSRKIDKKRLDRIGDYTVYLVNGGAVRDTTQGNDEFSQSSTHLEMPKLVPNNEIWIANDISKHERQFLIYNGINQYEAKRKGKRNWYDYALKKERREREVIDNIKFSPQSTDKKPPDKVYDKYYCGIPNEKDDVEVWLVNGEIVRDMFKTDFVSGGNGLCYSFVPNQEIWIEKNLEEKLEIPITILHEYVERALMKYKKLSYDEAHTIASKVDWKKRRKFDKTDVMALSIEEALKFAKTYL